MQLTIDTSQLKAYAASLQALGEAGLATALVSSDVVQKVRVYLTAEMDRALAAGKGLQEGQSATIRGQTWRGWASKQVTKYGTTVVEGTRFYQRKFRRDPSATGLTAAKDRENDLKGKDYRTADEIRELEQLRKLLRTKGKIRAGTIGTRGKARSQWESKKVKDRPFEKVWRIRSSGKPYSEKSELMRDTGAMSRAWGNLSTTVVTGPSASVTFKPGTQINYFEVQNALRPIFVFDNPKDEAKILTFIDMALQKMIRERLKAK